MVAPAPIRAGWRARAVGIKEPCTLTTCRTFDTCAKAARSANDPSLERPAPAIASRKRGIAALFARVCELAKFDTSDIDLVQAQIAAFALQMPLLYFIVCVNMIALAYEYYGAAPRALTVYAPVGICGVCLLRSYNWFSLRRSPPDHPTAVRYLRMLFVFSVAFSLLFVAWALELSSYTIARPPGQMTPQGHVAFFIGVTVICCGFLLRQARVIALTVVAVVAALFVFYLATRGHITETALAINLFLVVAGVIYAMAAGSFEFENFIHSRAEMIELTRRFEQQANNDALTTLANRRAFFTELAVVQSCPERIRRIAVGVFDLDDFKAINDLYGHSTGDEVLREVGTRLQSFAGPLVFIARLGGDEFAVILYRVSSLNEILSFGERVCAIISTPIEVGDSSFTVGASAGFATSINGQTTRDTLYDHADYALYRAKAQGRGAAVVFAAEHAKTVKRGVLIEHCLRTADLESEMSLQFQPIVDVATGAPDGFEALARWKSPELGHVSPGEFIPIAERSEMISSLTLVLFRKMLAAARQLPDDLRVAFNLSARNLASPQLILEIKTLLERSDVDPRRVEVEVTETAFMNDFGMARSSIGLIKSLGARIALDDFGTGYSSLSHAHRLPLDKLKIDRSFICDIESNPLSRQIVSTIISLSQQMQIDCVVEGVETQEQVDVLQRLGCAKMQGYFFARPLDFEDARAFARTHGSMALQRTGSG